MDYVLFMTIVDAEEDLAHEYLSILLSEFSSGDDFIKELTTFADFGNDVVSFFILKELVHFDNVRVI